MATQAKHICVDNLSTPLYAEILREAGGKEIAFDCPVEIRFSRTRTIHDEAKYPDTIEAFIHNEQEDGKVSIGPGLGLETAKLMQTADYHTDATQPLREVLRRIDEIIRPLVG